MGGLTRAWKSNRRPGGICLALGVAAARLVSAAEPPWPERWLPPQSTVVLLAGLTGDVESENSYRDQLQGWLDLLGSVVPPPERVFVLWENPWTVTPPAGLAVQNLDSGREPFLSLAKTLTGQTNPLVVVALGHGGMQGRTPVFHVRGPRLTAADFKTLAGAATSAGESRWLLFFRGSGRFAAELAAERRQIISSDLDTPFNSDPIAGTLALKTARANPGASFLTLAGELGRLAGAWYEERQLARTEEPALWLPGAAPRRLVAAEKGSALTALATAKKPAPRTPETPAREAAPAERPAIWKEITRVEPQRFPEADAVVLRQRVSFTLGAAPAIASEHEEFVQILTADGKQSGDFDVSYSPPEEEIQFLDCEVLCPDGKLLRLDPDDIRESTGRAPGDYRTARRKFFSLPGVAPGAVLRVHYRTEWKSYPLPHISLAIPLAGALPVVESAVQVTVPKDSAFHFLFDHAPAADPELKQSTQGSAYSWQFKDVPAATAEALAPPHHQSALLVSTFPDWAAFAGWYARISKLTDEITPEISAKAKELTSDAATDRDKVRALYDYVTRLRYVAVPLGVNSFRPHAAAGVLKNQFGDCKDKANLFNTLLHSLGLEARLVLVPRFSQAHEALPGLAFNHAISRVKLGDDLLWLDTTDDGCRFGMLPPGDPGRNVLVIDGESTKLTPLPRPLPRDHGLRLRGRVKVGRGGAPSALSLEVKASGIVDYDLRDSARAFKGQARNLPLLGGQFRNTAGTFAMTGQSSTSPSTLDEDFAWRAEGECVGMVSQDGPSHRLRAPFWLPKEWDAALHARQSPLFLNRGYPLTLDEEILFIVSPGEKGQAFSKLPEPRHEDIGPLSWRVSWSRSADGLRAALRLELESGELSELETRRFQAACRELLTVLAQEVTLTTNGHE